MSKSNPRDPGIFIVFTFVGIAMMIFLVWLVVYISVDQSNRGSFCEDAMDHLSVYKAKEASWESELSEGLIACHQNYKCESAGICSRRMVFEYK